MRISDWSSDVCSSDLGGGEERRNSRTAGAQALGQGALRVEFELELTGQELPLELLVLAHVGRNHLLDLPRSQQLAEAEAVDAGVVGDPRQALDPGITQRGDQRLGAAPQAEASAGAGLVVGNAAATRGGGIRVGLAGACRAPRG